MAIGTIGKYERLDVLGHGTSGVVYLAWDTLLRRQVALKEIRAAEPEWERVLEEARVLDRLGRHPHIVHINAVDHENGAILIDMELVKGRNLSEVLRLRNGEPLLPREAVRVARAVLSALQYAHEKRIIHRDVKPANILIGGDDGQTVKLTDFGLAEALGTGSVAGGGGTYPYMAPEDFADDADSDYRSDLWAVGVVLYEMLAGKRPFAVAPRPGSARAANADPFAWKRVIEEAQAPPLLGTRPGISRELDEVVRRSLSKEKADRFPSAQIFADALQAALRTLPEVPLSEQVAYAPPAFAPPEALPSTGAAMYPAPESAPENAASQNENTPNSEPVFVFGSGVTVAATLDELLFGAAKHWDEGRAAFLSGRMETFLRGIGEVYIADLARELAAAPGNADKRFREFLARSQGEAPPASPDAPEDATLPFRGRKRVSRRAASPPDPVSHLNGGDLPEAERGSLQNAQFMQGANTADATSAAAEPVSDIQAPPFRDGRAQRGAGGRGQAVSRWWFWPVFLLCLGPLAGAFDLMQNVGGSGSSQVSARLTALLAAWAASGFCAALLLLVGIGAKFPFYARMVCALPIMGGLVAVGALVAGRMGGSPSPDLLVQIGIVLILPLIILLFVAGTTGRLWKLWAWVTVLCAVVLTLRNFVG